MNRSFTYPANLEQGTDGRVTVSFPDLPEALTDGADIKEALEEAADCLDEALANRIVSELDIPEPSKSKEDQILVSAPALMAAKTALYLAMKESGISKSELARRTNFDVREIRRLLDPRHPSKLPRIEVALAAIGQQLDIKMRAAAG